MDASSTELELENCLHKWDSFLPNPHCSSFPSETLFFPTLTVQVLPVRLFSFLLCRILTCSGFATGTQTLFFFAESSLVHVFPLRLRLFSFLFCPILTCSGFATVTQTLFFSFLPNPHLFRFCHSDSDSFLFFLAQSSLVQVSPLRLRLFSFLFCPILTCSGFATET
jgi:hypothetical protein